MVNKKKRKLRVFLSYAKSDKEKIWPLFLRLKKDDIDVWVDENNLGPGVDWELELKKAIENSDIVIFCITKRFNQKGYRQKELVFALEAETKQPEGSIFIVPIRFEKTKVPDRIKKWQYVDWYDKDGYEKIYRTLLTRAANIGVNGPIRRRYGENVRAPIRRTFLVFGPEDTIEIARNEMKEKGVNFALVRPDQGNIWQIFTKTDLLIAIATGDDLSLETLKSFSSPILFEASINWTIERAINEMVNNGVSHLPVYDKNRNIVGIIDGGDLVFV